jgi:DNA (cytosine-5)-methyltransferase 1
MRVVKKKNYIVRDDEEKEIKFIEVCSGAGGLSKGFMNQNFIPILLNDYDKICCKTLKANHNDIEIINDSFTNIDFNKHKNIDLLMGGVPCQSFSQAGKRGGLEDERGNLILEFIKVIDKVNPKVFLIENVKGLLTHNDGKTFDYIIKTINNLKKYKVYHKVLNANDYGVAQKRERLIIIGVCNSIKKEYIFPQKDENKLVLKDVLKDVPKSDGYNYPEEKKKIMELVPEGGCWIDLPEDIQKQYMKKSFYSGGGKRGIARRLSMNEPSLTLTTSPCQKQTERCHPIETRPLNIREYARIQSFPDDYIFVGSIAQQYKQIGNAVPVKLAEKIAISIRKIFE